MQQREWTAEERLEFAANFMEQLTASRFCDACTIVEDVPFLALPDESERNYGRRIIEWLRTGKVPERRSGTDRRKAVRP